MLELLNWREIPQIIDICHKLSHLHSRNLIKFIQGKKTADKDAN